MRVIDNKFELGQIVFLKTDTHQNERIITAFTVREALIVYELSFGTETSDHNHFEISKDKDLLLATTN